MRIPIEQINCDKKSRMIMRPPIEANPHQVKQRSRGGPGLRNFLLVDIAQISSFSPNKIKFPTVGLL